MKLLKEHIAEISSVACILGIAIILRFSRLGDSDNSYYTATVASLLYNPHNFLFASFDPGGYIMVDKPPLSFWIQAIPASIFGVSSWTVTLPQTLAGITAIILMYFSLRKSFGHYTGLVGASILTIIPVGVIIDSRNEPDGILALILLLAAISIMKAAHTGKWIWLITFALLMGLAFNTKMLVAFVPLPIFIVYYMLATKESLKTLAKRMVLAIVVLLAVSSAWLSIIYFTPADQRPYVGSTQDNSILTLVFKYNGINRFSSFNRPRPPQAEIQAAINPFPSPQVPPSPPPFSRPLLDNQPQQPRIDNSPGSNGIASLFARRLSQQLGWILPLSILMLLSSLITLLKRNVYFNPLRIFPAIRRSRENSEMILWTGWLATGILVFGLADATTTHPYYLVGICVPLAATISIGLRKLIQSFHHNKYASFTYLFAVIGTAIYQIYHANQLVHDWIVATETIVIIASGLILLVSLYRHVGKSKLVTLGIGLSIASISIIPLATSISLDRPFLGPIPNMQAGMPDIRSQPISRDPEIISSFIQQRGDVGSIFTIGTISAREASPFIIAGFPALAIGGFSGNDPVFTVESFNDMARRGELQYFLFPDNRNPIARRPVNQQREITNYIRNNWLDVSRASRLPIGTLYKYK